MDEANGTFNSAVTIHDSAATTGPPAPTLLRGPPLTWSPGEGRDPVGGGGCSSQCKLGITRLAPCTWEAVRVAGGAQGVTGSRGTESRALLRLALVLQKLQPRAQ